DAQRQLLRVVWVELELAERVADRVAVRDARELGVERVLQAGGAELARCVADDAAEGVVAVDAVWLAGIRVALVRGEGLAVAVGGERADDGSGWCDDGRVPP